MDRFKIRQDSHGLAFKVLQKMQQNKQIQPAHHTGLMCAHNFITSLLVPSHYQQYTSNILSGSNKSYLKNKYNVHKNF